MPEGCRQKQDSLLRGYGLHGKPSEIDVLYKLVLWTGLDLRQQPRKYIVEAIWPRCFLRWTITENTDIPAALTLLMKKIHPQTKVRGTFHFGKNDG